MRLVSLAARSMGIPFASRASGGVGREGSVRKGMTSMSAKVLVLSVEGEKSRTRRQRLSDGDEDFGGAVGGVLSSSDEDSWYEDTLEENAGC